MVMAEEWSTVVEDRPVPSCVASFFSSFLFFISHPLFSSTYGKNVMLFLFIIIILPFCPPVNTDVGAASKVANPASRGHQLEDQHSVDWRLWLDTGAGWLGSSGLATEEEPVNCNCVYVLEDFLRKGDNTSLRWTVVFVCRGGAYFAVIGVCVLDFFFLWEERQYIMVDSSLPVEEERWCCSV
ncbi:unnamed protein product [Calypogeia fissa]